MVTCDMSPNGLWTSRSSGTYLTAGSSSDSSPRSRSCMIATPVNVLVIDAQWKMVSSSTLRFVSRSW